MTARLRKGLAFVSGAGVAYLSLIGPLLGVMLMTGGAVQVMPAMVGFPTIRGRGWTAP